MIARLTDSQGTAAIGGDGARCQTNSTRLAPGQFACDRYGYLIQFQTLYRVDLVTGLTTSYVTYTDPTYTANTRNLNAMGYNTIDYFLYAVAQIGSAGVNQVVRMYPNGSYDAVMSSPGNTAVNGNNNWYWLLGDIDNDGMLWLADPPNGNNKGLLAWAQVDLNPNRATFGTTIARNSVQCTTSPQQFADWTYVPGGGRNLWTFACTNDGSAWLYSWSMDSKTCTNVGTTGRLFPANSTNVVVGATYATSDGYLYAVENSSGYIARIYVAGDFGYGITNSRRSSSSNDGARCALAPDSST